MTVTKKNANFGKNGVVPPLKKIINGRLGKTAIDMPDSSMMKKTAANSKAKGKKRGSTHGLLGSCQGKDAGFLFRLNYSIHQHRHWL